MNQVKVGWPSQLLSNTNGGVSFDIADGVVNQIKSLND